MRLEGKRAVVTGGTGALGSAICRALARDGADVAIDYLLDSDAPRAEKLVGEIEEIGQRAVAIQADVRESKAIQELIDGTVETLGGLDIVVNNAATGPQIPLLDLTEEVLDDFLQTNLRGYFLVALYGAREMIKEGNSGRIVNVSSISSRSMTSTYVHYSATKGGIEAMTRGMAVALGSHEIRVNAVAPGAVMTPTVANMFEEPRNADPVNERTPLGRIVTIEEAIAPVVWLCTEEASGITGQVIDVDNGYSIAGMEWVLTDEIVSFREKLEEAGYEA